MSNYKSIQDLHQSARNRDSRKAQVSEVLTDLDTLGRRLDAVTFAIMI